MAYQTWMTRKINEWIDGLGIRPATVDTPTPAMNVAVTGDVERLFPGILAAADAEVWARAESVRRDLEANAQAREAKARQCGHQPPCPVPGGPVRLGRADEPVTDPRQPDTTPAELIPLAPARCGLCGAQMPFGAQHVCDLGSDYQQQRRAA